MSSFLNLNIRFLSLPERDVADRFEVDIFNCPPFRLYLTDGCLEEFDSIEDLVLANEAFYLASFDEFGSTPKKVITDDHGQPLFVRHFHYVENVYGEIVPPSVLRYFVPPREPYYYQGPVSDAAYRRDPVSGTGKKHYGRFFRHPKTHQAYRQAIACEDWGEEDIPTHLNTIHLPRPRGRRRPPSLPNAWDDRLICYQKSWKKHRRHQWKND